MIACFVYLVCSSESPFVYRGFKNWKKAFGKSGYVDQHKRSEYHKIADEKAASFLHTHQPGTDILSSLNKQVNEQQIRTKGEILSIIDSCFRTERDSS